MTSFAFAVERGLQLARCRYSAGVTEGGSEGATGSAGARPIKRSRASTETGATAEGSGLPVNEFEGVDLAGISRKFPMEKRLELAARIDAAAVGPPCDR